MGISFDIITVIHQASITDWIQAIAALLAVVGTVATLWKLYQRDEQKQAMIAELKTQSAAAVDQARHLSEQVTQLGQQVFQLERIHEAIAKGIEFMAKDEGLKAEIKKIEMRPDFEFQSHMAKPGRVEATLKAVNRGGLARNLRLTKPEGIAVTAECPAEVRPADNLSVRIRSLEMMEVAPIYDLHFEDALGNAYVQRFDMRYGMPKAGAVRPYKTTDEPMTP
ncbi:MAG TPA: hypothetical protein PKE21_14260 [Flavobacteriales bacterium]|nr:hypothetical protein [Flavobacteriales bacterium]HMR28642.1 hypothetical protein [Flavobacteriales bacterium]